MSALGIWMNGRYVGEWRQVRGGRDQFSYAQEWRSDRQARALSLSIPLTAEGTITSTAVRNYFDNLLPDDPRIRDRLKTRFGLRSSGTFELLEALGRDCVGAVQLMPVGIEPEGWDQIKTRPLKTREVEALLDAVPTTTRPLLAGEPDDSRISLAGAQEKTALLKLGRTWHLPLGSTPTTHILKLPLGLVGGLKLDLSHSVDNEWLCAQFLQALKFPGAKTDIGRFGAQRVLVVQRFDRRWRAIGDADPQSANFIPPKGAWIARLPQEDFCQATGLPSQDKYQVNGGPGIKDILRILARAEHPDESQRSFVLAQFAFWLLAAIDGHAKNFSIGHRRGGAYDLTPLYDVLSAWPVIGHGANKLSAQKVKLAMGVRGGSRLHYKLSEIQPRHFHALAESVADQSVWAAMLRMAGSIPEIVRSLESRLPKDFAPSVWEAVSAGVKQQALRFLKAAGPTGADAG